MISLFSLPSERLPQSVIMLLVLFIAPAAYAQDAVLDQVLKEPDAPSTSDGDSAVTSSADDSQKPDEKSDEKAQNETSPDDENAEEPQDSADDAAERDDAVQNNVISGATCSGEQPCIVEKTGLPLRALARSFSPLFDEPSESATPISSAVSAFKPLYVFDSQGLDRSDVTDVKGWYQIGFTERLAMGWMQAQDIVEWRQALLLEYLHPGSGSDKRSPVVMFKDKESLRNLLTDADREKRVGQILGAINKGDQPPGVIGRESEQFLNIDETFYLLPITDWERERSLDERSHYLQVFAAVPGARAQATGEGTLDDEKFLKEQLTPEDGIIDIVFVIDMTGSMQPYIDSVKRMVKKLVSSAESGVSDLDTVRFGLVGFRDSTDVTPDLEWTVKNFTQGALVDSAQLLTILDSDVAAANVSSDEWAEDVLGGYLAGIESPWRTTHNDQRSVRIMMLVGDASGHGMDNVKNSASINPLDLNQQARGLGIYPYAIHIRDNRAEPDWTKAQAQFNVLGTGGQGDSPASVSVSAERAVIDLESTTEFLAEELALRVSRDASGKADKSANSDTGQGSDSDASNDGLMIDVARGVIQAALVDFLGDDVKPPRDFLSWVHDYDLADATREALGVRVMVSRRQLDNVLGQTESLLDAIKANTVGNLDFLETLKRTAVTTSLGTDIDANVSFESQEYLPRWISSLPYQSRVMQMTPAGFANLDTTDRREFESRLESKVETYRKLLATPERWVLLDESDDTLDEVMGLPLTLLP